MSCAPEARKLLTFVDNRQDASLQAGHFNDFVQVTQLRGAPATARCATSPDGLTHEARRPAGHRRPGPGRCGDVCRQPRRAVLGPRPGRRRRFATSSSTGSTPTCSAASASPCPTWSRPGCCTSTTSTSPRSPRRRSPGPTAVPELRDADPALREELAGILLDELRRVLAVDVDCLTETGFERLAARVRPAPRPARGRSPRASGWPRPARPTPRRGPRPGRSAADLFVSGRSAFGRYLRRDGDGLGPALTTDDAQQVIDDIFRVLERSRAAHRRRRASTASPATGSRPRRSAGSPATAARAPRTRCASPSTPTHVVRVNPFFRDLYRDVAESLRGPAGQGAHRPGARPSCARSARTPSATGDLPLLFCSPTMELGRRHRRASTPSGCATCRRHRPTTPSAPAAPAAPASRPSSSPTAPPATPTTRTTSATP